jgi:hypothetical protein
VSVESVQREMSREEYNKYNHIHTSPSMCPAEQHEQQQLTDAHIATPERQLKMIMLLLAAVQRASGHMRDGSTLGETKKEQKEIMQVSVCVNIYLCECVIYICV